VASKLVVVLAATAFVVATATGGLDAAARPGTTCTAAQKAARENALAAYRKRMLGQRTAYFKTHKDPGERRRFVRRQRARLAVLRAAAACTVPPSTPPIPPSSSGPACAPSLSSASNPDPYNEGTDTDPRFPRSVGTLRAIVLFVDTADRPETGLPAVDALPIEALTAYYRDTSYGRLSLDVTPVAKWFRLPQAAAAYSDNPFDPDRNFALFRDAVAAADPEVDFRGVDIVYVVATPLVGSGRGGFARQSIVADGTGLLHFAEFAVPASNAHVIVHETGHVFGLPHVVAGFWDPMSVGVGIDYPFLGWQRYKLHWIEPDQIRCLDGPGVLEDTLAPVDGAGGLKLLVARTSPSTAVVAEFKQNAGGVLVTTVDADAPTPDGLVVQTGGRSLEAAALTPGQQVTTGNVTVETIAADSKAARVRMTWR
jgi:M6 family metalloprotease-like protein